MSELSYQSPLAGVAEPQGLSISIREIAERGMIDLRGLTTDAGFMAAVKGALGDVRFTAPLAGSMAYAVT